VKYNFQVDRIMLFAYNLNLSEQMRPLHIVSSLRNRPLLGPDRSVPNSVKVPYPGGK
jgi:hypothetical protein